MNRQLWWKCAICVLLIAWMGAMAYTTIGSREAREMLSHNFIPFHSYREVWAGGNPEIYRSNFMNVMLFYPAGLLTESLLPEKWPRWCRVLLTLVLFAAVSAGIEYAQYAYALGRVEIDDVIHNSLGALLGSIVGVVDMKLTEIGGC